MKISIITPCFNAEQYIEETIESVIFQRGDFDIEYIIIDNLSADNTEKIVNYYINLHKENKLKINCNNLEIKYIRETDNGLYDALAKGFEIITGDIIAYINADDYYLPNSFKTITNIFKSNKKLKWLNGLSVSYNEDGSIIGIWPLPTIKRKHIQYGFFGNIYYHIQQESCFWRKELLNKIDMNIFRKYKYAGDYYLWKSFAEENNIYTVHSALSGFRHRENQLSSVCFDKYKEEFNQIKENSSFFDKIEAVILNFYWKISEGKHYITKKRFSHIYYDMHNKIWKMYKKPK